MQSSEPADSRADVTDADTSPIAFQLAVLKLEIESINQVIGRMDEITQKTKDWAIVTWAGSIALFLGQDDLRQYVFFSAIIPLLFWLIDAHWRHLQRRSIYRMDKISEFLNSHLFVQSFEQRSLVDTFKVLDPVGRQYQESEEYLSFVNIRKTFQFASVYFVYVSMSFVSLIFYMVFRYLILQ